MTKKKTTATATPEVHATKEEAAWLAGYVDARGDLSAWTAPAGTRAFMLIDEATATDMLIPRWGGTFKKFTSPKKSKEISGWFISVDETQAVLEAVLPHSRVRAGRIKSTLHRITTRPSQT